MLNLLNMRATMRNRMTGIIVIAVVSVLVCPSILLAAGTTIDVSAVILSKSQCKFSSNTNTMSFGNIDPTLGATYNVVVNIIFSCKGSAPIAAYSIADDNGLHSVVAGEKRMKHSALNVFMPYSVTLNPLNGTIPKNTDTTLTVTGTLTPADYGAAVAGTYNDTFNISIVP
jgi:hypothetical protein